MARAIVLVLDSLGIGATPDAQDFGDTGACTLGSIMAWRHALGKPLHIPNLMQWGLGHALENATGQWPESMAKVTPKDSYYGAAAETSKGKDTPSGHWEMMGCPVLFDWGYFPPTPLNTNVFPDALMQEWYKACGIRGSLGNCHASGTEIITQWGTTHLQAGMPICYTSADSVFQIAMHESMGLETLYAWCEKAKPIFDKAHIARVIARPFTGDDGNYTRTGHRRDYTTPPPSETLLDRLIQQHREVHAVGKISDIFAHRGITQMYKADGNDALGEQTLEAMKTCPEGGLVFTNFVDFDMLYGHRRDIEGYADALEKFDLFLNTFKQAMRPDDLVVITADHGCDPSWPGSDHTREYVPMLVAGPAILKASNLGLRASFADIGQTLATHLNVGPLAYGRTCL